MRLRKGPYHRHGGQLFVSYCLLSGLILAPASAAQDRKDAAENNLSRLEEQIKKSEAEKTELEAAADRAAQDAQKLSANLVAVAKELRLTEENALRLEQRITDLEAEAKNKKATLETRRYELLKLLSSLERLSARPAVFTFLQPEEALKTARSASLMGTLVPNINARAAALKNELSALADIQKKLSAERFSLKNTLAELTQHQLNLASLLDKRKAEAASARSAAEKTRKELAEFARKATSLRDLIDKLEQQAAKQAKAAPLRVRPVERDRPVAPAMKPMGQMKGSLPYPAIGQIITRYGAKEGAGHAKGITIKARTKAQIVSPYDGQIVFAGPFRGYGQLLIISHGNGYHSLLAGLANLQATVGQWVLTGEPLGTMSDRSDLTELYLELRHKGDTLDPQPWLSKQTASVE
ncbi:murein hydrolase activator EnvC family protein [Kordiimonas sp.]|uniref:murein hydrolase activator EnvC family protein n=1 Tax=Kordiimonas sp. TaxID=1970157 RepID=UPI003A93C949